MTMQADAGQGIIIASLSNPPLRLLLGSDAFWFEEPSDTEKMESDRRWKRLSISIDIEPRNSTRV